MGAWLEKPVSVSFRTGAQGSGPSPLRKPLLGSLQAHCVCSVIVTTAADGRRKLRDTRLFTPSALHTLLPRRGFAPRSGKLLSKFLFFCLSDSFNEFLLTQSSFNTKGVMEWSTAFVDSTFQSSQVKMGTINLSCLCVWDKASCVRSCNFDNELQWIQFLGVRRA